MVPALGELNLEWETNYISAKKDGAHSKETLAQGIRQCALKEWMVEPEKGLGGNLVKWQGRLFWVDGTTFARP